MLSDPLDPLSLISPNRKTCGIAAVLLPFREEGDVDWPGFESLLVKTLDSGLTPAVNMDTGYVNLLDAETQQAVLERTKNVTSGRRFVAGAYVADSPGDVFTPDRYAQRIEAVQTAGGVPLIFQSYGLAHQPDDQVADSYRRLAKECDEFIAFELGRMFAPFGAIYSLELYRELMGIPNCSGAKHSSLNRVLEWQRLVLRNRVRPDFRVYTGNDLAIDMIIYGSDYLLGLSSLAPDAFARRDALWEAGDPSWNELNDLLQHLGFLAFRDPVPAYKHSAALFLRARGWVASSSTHPQSPRREPSDQVLLKQIAGTLEDRMKAGADNGENR